MSRPIAAHITAPSSSSSSASPSPAPPPPPPPPPAAPVISQARLSTGKRPACPSPSADCVAGGSVKRVARPLRGAATATVTHAPPAAAVTVLSSFPFTTVDQVAAAVDASIEADQPGRVYAALRREGRGGQLLGCGGDRRACACATTASPLHHHLRRLPVVVGSRLLVVLLLLFSLLLSLPDRRQRQWWTDEGLRGG